MLVAAYLLPRIIGGVAQDGVLPCAKYEVQSQ
jgi:hypothetical protein